MEPAEDLIAEMPTRQRISKAALQALTYSDVGASPRAGESKSRPRRKATLLTSELFFEHQTLSASVNPPPQAVKTTEARRVIAMRLRKLTLLDVIRRATLGVVHVIDEMMEAYWREQADRLDPDAGALLHRALDIFAESRIARVSSEGDAQETP